jgi:hypothetical protein
MRSDPAASRSIVVATTQVQEANMRCVICRLLLIATVIFMAIFMVQAEADFRDLPQTLAEVAVLALLAILLYALWQHLKQWRRPIIIVVLSALGLAGLVAMVKTPELQQLAASLLRGISLEGALPLVFAVLCIITYGVLGLAHPVSRQP